MWTITREKNSLGASPRRDRKATTYMCGTSTSHFAFPDVTSTRAEWEYSSHDDVKSWHANTCAILCQRPNLQPPTPMQHTDKTLNIYRETLYPTLTQFDIREIVEDNNVDDNPHNNDEIRTSHRVQGARILGYTVTAAEKE